MIDAKDSLRVPPNCLVKENTYFGFYFFYVEWIMLSEADEIH